MLELLRIRNLALIEDMELDFAPGLNVLSGETGAGKSFILKAIGFLTGDRLDTDLVRPGEEKAQAEALFAQAGEDLVLRRELAADTGRSRVYVNDALGSQDRIRDLRAGLILHTSQHGQQRLLAPAYQLRILDAFLDNATLVEEKDRLAKALRELADRKDACQERCRTLEDKRELLEYQKSEIAKVAPRAGEEDDLLARRQALRGQEQVKERIGEAVGLLLGQEAGLIDGLGALSRCLDSVAAIVPGYEADREAVEDFRHHAAELASRLRRQNLDDAGDDDPEVLEKRLWELAQLKRKLKRPLDEIVRLGEEIDANLSFLDACNLDLAQLDKEGKKLATALADALARLNTARREAADRLCATLATELAGLGFSDALRVEVSFAPHALFPEWDAALAEDRPRILWAPNPGLAPQPLDRIASGGELSRFLLAVVGLMSRGDDAPTLIFDEVDSGVGGLTLTRVGERIKALAEKRQVILITHWPQLASLADRHFHVRKEVRDGQTFTFCERLTGPAIRDELSRMAGGGDQGAALADQLLVG
ncbi:MAG: DNA repair protein RecN [Desulfovibrionaceae bacterium]